MRIGQQRPLSHREGSPLETSFQGNDRWLLENADLWKVAARMCEGDFAQTRVYVTISHGLQRTLGFKAIVAIVVVVSVVGVFVVFAVVVVFVVVVVVVGVCHRRRSLPSSPSSSSGQVLFATGESGHAYIITVELTQCSLTVCVWVDWEDVTVLFTHMHAKSPEPSAKRSRHQ